ncbi:MAG: response regulator transcription factor [Actinobacteria bacterium]|nr:response regulator transcription factor [Actinomycetota bacterium]MBV8395783.1 response regulator transcription factor [Actinomycetota bacterium]
MERGSSRRGEGTSGTVPTVLLAADDWRLREALHRVLDRGAELRDVTLAELESDDAPDSDIAVVATIPGDGPSYPRVRTIRRRWPDTPILVVREQATEHGAFLALKEGASGFVSAEDATPELIASALTLVRGGALVAVGARARAALDRLAQREAATPAEWYGLTPREIDVLTRVTRGDANRAIAAELGITNQAVKNHVARILRKLGVANRTAAATLARKESIVGI